MEQKILIVNDEPGQRVVYLDPATLAVLGGITHSYLEEIKEIPGCFQYLSPLDQAAYYCYAGYAEFDRADPLAVSGRHPSTEEVWEYVDQIRAEDPGKARDIGRLASQIDMLLIQLENITRR